MMFYIILLVYLIAGLLWVNKLGNDNIITNPIQLVFLLMAWPISIIFYRNGK